MLKEMPKHVTNSSTKFKTEERYERKDYIASAENDYKFMIYLRQNKDHQDDFSCGIRWIMPSGETLTLARYNGPSHRHYDIAYKCHIHKATEEAIRAGKKPEHYAEESTKYNTLNGALHCLVKDFNVQGVQTVPDPRGLF